MCLLCPACAVCTMLEWGACSAHGPGADLNAQLFIFYLLAKILVTGLFKIYFIKFYIQQNFMVNQQLKHLLNCQIYLMTKKKILMK